MNLICSWPSSSIFVIWSRLKLLDGFEKEGWSKEGNGVSFKPKIANILNWEEQIRDFFLNLVNIAYNLK